MIVRLGNNVCFLAKRLEKGHVSDCLARIATLPQWTPCICSTYSPEERGDWLFEMPSECGPNLQISLGKTRNVPTCDKGLMTLHVAAKEHMTP